MKLSSPQDLNTRGRLREDAKSMNKLTREQLLELEEREKTPKQKRADLFFVFMPLVCGMIALLEYLLMPDVNANPMPYLYTVALSIAISAYVVALIAGSIKAKSGNKKTFQYLRYKAPLYSVIFLLLTAYDIATIKTGFLTFPLVPCINSILFGAFSDRAVLLTSTIHTLRLMFTGYFIGVVLGLITGITCGYSRKVHYWVDPIIKFLGPIPISTWIPIIMVFTAGALSFGAVFIIVIGVWYAVTVASMTGVANVNKSYFDAAKILGASERQLIFRVAIPHAMPNILQGMTQGMSTACTAIMVAEMMGVKAGLGWYITWVKSWALYNNMFASLVVICIIFTLVTKILSLIKKRVLRWQIGVVK